ncbi:hypothetical protein KBZ18_10000 [Synechococcus sp. Cruz-9H2]|nr:hypothetical protein [Synechococcus sp. Cruz-9H2]MCP9844110.1 hypothetical protein [Synechococcus sp. Edmonson 11F2]MCP9856254.1 hypothetical protein [Synechococcus sp. Cruz-9C9]MCP9863539.1 hypothetical protein [Synechococcus sp. Cruz-7E5]MCP9870735.1 hypothetical protein [Synechococcus sp. Cruz-7B9]
MPPPELQEVSRRLDLISAQLTQLEARLQLAPARNSKSPWLPIAVAAGALHYSSTRALRAAINRGRIPTQFVRAVPGPSGKRHTIYIDVEAFASHLRHQ